MQFRDLKQQYQVLQKDIDEAMLSVAASSAYINGAPVKELESQLADYVGVKHCVTCANGTDALSIALKVWGIGPGDAVFVPDFTFFSSAEVVAAEGATPIFVDVDATTYNIDVRDLERAIKQIEAEGRLTPKVVIAVDLFGLPANYPEINKIAASHNLLVLEDGAQGFGGAIDSSLMTNDSSNMTQRRACSFGDISTTSFFPAKPLGCYGDGGAIFTNNEDWAQLAESYRVHGKGSFKYDNVRIGMNSRLDTIQAAILQVKLKAFKDYELDAVNRVAERYTELLAPLVGQDIVALPIIPECWYSSWAQYTIQLKDNATRDGLQMSLKEQGIPSMVYYPKGMHQQTAFSQLSALSSQLKTTERLCDTVLSLPMHPYMTEDDIQTVVNAIKNSLNF